jgi:hypothetical protein
MQKLKSLQKIKSFGLILREIDKIIAYIENNQLFVSLQNAIKNDFFGFLEELNSTFSDSYDFNNSTAHTLRLVDQQIELNKKFERSEVKILLSAFEIFATSLKEGLSVNLKGSKGRFKLSNQKVKTLGYLSYFETEVENQATDEFNDYFAYYPKFHENMLKLITIVKEKRMMDLFEVQINERLIEILSILVQCVSADVESLRSVSVEKLRSFISAFGPLLADMPVMFKSFEFGAMLAKFKEPIKTLTKFAIEGQSEISEISELSLYTANEVQFLEIIVDKLKTFTDSITIPLKLTGAETIVDFIGKLLEKVTKSIFKVYSSHSQASKLKVL